MKNAPLDYLAIGRTRIGATGVAAVFGIGGTGKTSRAVLPILSQFGEKLACAAPAVYLSANSTDATFDAGKVIVTAPRPERGGATDDTEWRAFAVNSLAQFAQSNEVYRALAIDGDIIAYLGSDGETALAAAIASASGSACKFLLVTASSIKMLPPAIGTALEKAATTRIFFTIVDIDTIELVRTTVFPRSFWLPRRAHPRDLRANGRYADAIIEVEIGKVRESYFTRLRGLVKTTPGGETASHMERFNR